MQLPSAALGSTLLLGWALAGCSPDASSPVVAQAGSAGSAANVAGGGGSAGRGGSSGGGGSAGGGASANVAGAGPIQLANCAIGTPTRWAAAVYVAACNVEVSSSLTIDPGAIIKFGTGFSLSVRDGGVLMAVGTESQPIVFTSLKDDAHGGDSNADGVSSAAPGDWGCQGACGDVNLDADGSQLEHVLDLFGSNGVYVRAGSVTVKSAVLAHHAGYGLVLDEVTAPGATQLTGNVFFGNGGYPLRLARPVFVDASNLFHDPANPQTTNAKQCVELDTDIDQLVALGVTELGFLFSGHRIDSGVLFPPDAILKAKGSRITLGSTGSFVNGANSVFTSYADDALGGDCTGDGPTPPVSGDWEGLWIEDGTTTGFAAPVDYVRFAKNAGAMVLH